MSLLEDVFLEDEAGEARELERIIEGDEYDERPVSPDSDDSEVKEDEAEEDKRHVDPKAPKAVRVVKHPRFVLNPARLTGPRGIQVLPDHFKDFKFKGKGCEKEDLDMILKKLEHWAYRLYPKFGFKDCLKKIETLGKKRVVMVHLMKIRSDQVLSEETVVQKDSSDDEEPPPEDEFDKLLQQQIELARSTPAPNSVKKPPFTPGFDRSNLMPKATSSPSISEEQRERMLRNRRLAEERRLAKLNNDLNGPSKNSIPNEIAIEGVTEIAKEVRNNKPNVIDSSDDEMTVNGSVAVDVHKDVEIEGVAVKTKNRKHNRSIVDSSDEEMPVKESVAAKVHPDVEIIDDTEIRKEVRKHNKSVIDSSDDEMTVTESVAIDVHIDKGEENALDVAKRKSNVIDSSDDEEITVNESVAVDLHAGMNSNQNNEINGISDVNELNNTDDVNDSSSKGPVKPNDLETVSPKTVEVNSDTDFDKLLDSNVNNLGVEQIVDNDSQMNSSNVIPEIDASNTVRVDDKDSNIIGENEIEQQTEKEISDNCVKNNDVEDIMDVDFSEDF